MDKNKSCDNRRVRNKRRLERIRATVHDAPPSDAVMGYLSRIRNTPLFGVERSHVFLLRAATDPFKHRRASRSQGLPEKVLLFLGKSATRNPLEYKGRNSFTLPSANLAAHSIPFVNECQSQIAIPGWRTSPFLEGGIPQPAPLSDLCLRRPSRACPRSNS